MDLLCFAAWRIQIGLIFSQTEGMTAGSSNSLFISVYLFCEKQTKYKTNCSTMIGCTTVTFGWHWRCPQAEVWCCSLTIITCFLWQSSIKIMGSCVHSSHWVTLFCFARTLVCHSNGCKVDFLKNEFNSLLVDNSSWWLYSFSIRTAGQQHIYRDWDFRLWPQHTIQAESSPCDFLVQA